MDDDAVELVFVGLAEELSIGAHGVETDDKVTADYAALIVIEGNDVGVIVVAEIGVINLENRR